MNESIHRRTYAGYSNFEIENFEAKFEIISHIMFTKHEKGV